jgi:hypothetical protein
MILPFLLACSPLFARDPSVVPGEMGPNALPTITNADPAIDKDLYVELTMAGQLAEPGKAAATPFIKLTVPFKQLAALEVDWVPVELWTTPDGRGATHGDIRFGARFHLLDEGLVMPALGIRFVTKTTAGKDFADKRFTDAPGYVIDALAGKDVWKGDGFLRKIRLLAKLGFFAWQQGSDAQDDAVDFGGTAQAVFANGARVEVEYRGYAGWEKHDKPQVLGATAVYPATDWLDVAATINRGLNRDAPDWEFRTGLLGHFDVQKIGK